jgi:hypothetical protein
MASPLEGAPVLRTRLRDRDIEALAFIGKGYEVAQYQLHETIFPSRSPNVVSRFVREGQVQGVLPMPMWRIPREGSMSEQQKLRNAGRQNHGGMRPFTEVKRR